MFTVKLYEGERIRIHAAQSLTVLRAPDGSAEITLHQKNPADDFRVDLGWNDTPRDYYQPPLFSRAIIENAAGRTTEIFDLVPRPVNIPKAA